MEEFGSGESRLCESVCQAGSQVSSSDFVRRLQQEKPELIKDNQFLNKMYDELNIYMQDPKAIETMYGAAAPTSRSIIKSIQISDIHVDFKYKEGTAAEDCGYALCCRDYHPGQRLAPGARAAGKWGDYNCDLPYNTFKSMV